MDKTNNVVGLQSLTTNYWKYKSTDALMGYVIRNKIFKKATCKILILKFNNVKKAKTFKPDYKMVKFFD